MLTSTNWRRQGVSFSGYTVSTALAQLMVMLFSLLLARYFGPQVSGGYTSVFAISSLTAIAFNLGLDTWLLREGALSQDLRKTFSNVLLTKAAAGIVWAVLLFVIATNLRPDLYPMGLLTVCIMDVWFDAIFVSSLAVFNIERKIRQYSLLILLSRGLKLLGLIVLILIGNRNILMFAGWRALCSLVFAFTAVVIMKPRLGDHSLSNIKQILSQTRSFAISDLLATVYMQADVVILSNIKGKVATGVYSPALSLINALFVIPNAVYTYFIPSLSRWFKNNTDKFVDLAKKAILLLSVIGVIMSLSIALLGKPATALLLGEDYAVSGDLMVRLSPILLLKCLEFGFAAIIVAANKQKSRLIPQAIAAIVNVGLNLVLIPRLAEFGAAAVYLTTEVILFVSYGTIAVKTLNNTRKESVESI
ncbi:MAG: oligosaccharide flippase family protein [Chloroflexi bacterium]|nr:oligosaccharide flippase family protein [Chloroflexota bacterium]